MKNIQFNTKAKLCILWGGIGLISLLVGIFLTAPSPDSASLKIAIQSSSVSAMASAIITANNITVIKVIKGILCATGLILIAFSSVNFVSAIEEDEMYEDLMFDESAYEEDVEFSCSDADCACCSSPCGQSDVSEEDELMEEVILEETEEISENQEIK